MNIKIVELINIAESELKSLKGYERADIALRLANTYMITDGVENAEKTAQQFAENSHSTLNKIVSADQGQFSIDNRDENTPYIKKVRVVTTVTYSLKD